MNIKTQLIVCFAALFYLAHKLVDLYPDKAVSTFSLKL